MERTAVPSRDAPPPLGVYSSNGKLLFDVSVQRFPSFPSRRVAAHSSLKASARVHDSVRRARRTGRLLGSEERSVALASFASDEAYGPRDTGRHSCATADTSVTRAYRLTACMKRMLNVGLHNVCYIILFFLLP